MSIMARGQPSTASARTIFAPSLGVLLTASWFLVFHEVGNSIDQQIERNELHDRRRGVNRTRKKLAGMQGIQLYNIFVIDSSHRITVVGFL